MPEAIHRLMISEELFDLSTRVIRANSLISKRYETLNTTIQHASQLLIADPGMAAGLDLERLRQEIDGPVRVNLIIKGSWSQSFKAAQAHLSAAAQRKLSIKESFCLLLNAAHLNLERLR